MFKNYRELEMWLEYCHAEIKYESRIEPINVLGNEEKFYCDFSINGLAFTCEAEYNPICDWLKLEHDFQCYGLTKEEISKYINENMPFPGNNFLQEFVKNIKILEI